MARAWLRGEEVPGGLVVDADLRWKLMNALARLGAVVEDDIAAEAERDKTSAGAEKAAGVISALADADAKADAWRLATEDPSVPNETHRQICGNFFQYDQDELLASYAGRYVDVLTAMSDKTGVWAERSTAAREAVLRLLFPGPFADEAFVSRLKEWLGEAQRNEQVARGVRERVDEAERALACQAASQRA